MATAHGITDAVTTCDCCGKSNLKQTVIMELTSGELVHYGSVCAARNTGKTQKQIKREICKHEDYRMYTAKDEYLKTEVHRTRANLMHQRDKIGGFEGTRGEFTSKILALTPLDNEVRRD